MIRARKAMMVSNAYQRMKLTRNPDERSPYPYRADGGLECGACGEYGHLRKECPALKEGDVCRVCFKKVIRFENGNLSGHLEKMCYRVNPDRAFRQQDRESRRRAAIRFAEMGAKADA